MIVGGAKFEFANSIDLLAGEDIEEREFFLGEILTDGELLQKLTTLDSNVLPAETVLEMGTTGSAETLAIPAGRIALGYVALFT